MARQHYLSLHFDIWFDPTVRQLPARWKCALLDLLCYAVRSSEPGIITLSLPQLAISLGYRKLDKFEAFLVILEDRRILAFRKEDDAIVINPDYIPQVIVQDSDALFPRRRKPSEMAAAQAERQRRSRANRTKTGTLPMTDAEPDPPNVTRCHTPAQADPLIENNIDQSETKEQHTQVTPDVVVFSASPVLDLLTAQGVTKHVAQHLIEEYGEQACRTQLHNLPHRDAADPPAVLVKSIREGWYAPTAIREAEKTQQKSQAEQQRQAAHKDAEAQQKADEEACYQSRLAALTEPERKQLQRDAIIALPDSIKRIYREKGIKFPVVAGALDSQQKRMLAERTEKARSTT